MMPVLMADYPIQPLCPVCELAMVQRQSKENGVLIVYCDGQNCERAGIEYTYSRPAVILEPL
jgi:hypothetical protein